MSHATHFLERLERLSPAQTDMALALYRDPELVEYILTRIRLPEGSERVAMALEDRPDAPHIIVTRDGRFVTCLGEGMTVGDHPVVSRHATENLSEKIAAARTILQGEDSDTKDLYTRLLSDGSRFSREDFEAMASLMPIMAMDIVELATDVSGYVVPTGIGLGLERVGKVTPYQRERLRTYWNATWAVGHLTLILAERQDDIQAFAKKGRGLVETSLRALIQATMIVGYDSPTLFRGARALGCAGPGFLPLARNLLDGATDMRLMASASIGLTAIGLRNPRRQAEVIEKLSAYRDGSHSQNEEVNDAIVCFHNLLIDHFDPEKRAAAEKECFELGAELVVEHSESLAEDALYCFRRPEDVPDDLASATLLHLHGDILLTRRHIEVGALMASWAATADGAALYLPAEVLGRLPSTFDPRKLAYQLRAAKLGRKTIRRPETPGRNDPCGCGSGKKYKRCCGAPV